MPSLFHEHALLEPLTDRRLQDLKSDFLSDEKRVSAFRPRKQLPPSRPRKQKRTANPTIRANRLAHAIEFARQVATSRLVQTNLVSESHSATLVSSAAGNPSHERAPYASTLVQLA